jgi:nucleoside-diphosphate-sugar epimerase
VGTLVTGEAGYSGELLSQRLLVAGHDVQILDLHASDLVGAHAVRGDVRDPTVVRTVSEGLMSSSIPWLIP